MKKLYVILIFGLGTASLYATITPKHYNDAATIALAKAVGQLDVQGVTNALEDGANPNASLRVDRSSGHIFIISFGGSTCMDIVLKQAKTKDSHAVLSNGLLVKDAIAAIITTLVEHGLNINASVDTTSGPPLFALLKSTAIKNDVVDDPYITQALLNNGANITIKNKDGKTALMLAAFAGAPRIFQCLLEYGADTTLKDNEGHDVMYFITNNWWATQHKMDKAHKTADELLKALENYKRKVHAAAYAGTRTNPENWAPASSIVGEYLAGELKSKTQEEHKEMEDEE